MGRERRKEGENDGVPSYDTSVQGHTKRPKQEGRGKKGKRRREKERERETKKEIGGERRKKAGVPSYEQAPRDTPRRGVCT